MKERLTARDAFGNAHFPRCFEEPCLGAGCENPDCGFLMEVCEKLCRYEEIAAGAPTPTTKHKNNIRVHDTIICDKSQIHVVSDDRIKMDGVVYRECLVPEVLIL